MRGPGVSNSLDLYQRRTNLCQYNNIGFGTCLQNKVASSKHQNSLFSPSTWQCCHSVRQQIAIVWVPGVTSMVRIHTDMMGAADPEKKMQKNLEMKIVWEMAKIRGNPPYLLAWFCTLDIKLHKISYSDFLWKFLWVLFTRPVTVEGGITVQ